MKRRPAPHPSPEPATADFQQAWGLLPVDEAAARSALWQLLDAAEAQGDADSARCAAAALLVAIAIEFADFRGLQRALKAFQREGAVVATMPTGLSATEKALALDMARLTLPLLDGTEPFGPACEAAAGRVQRGLLDTACPLAPNVRMMALKLLLDYRGQQLAQGPIEHLIALGHEIAASPGVSPAWQGRWWLLVLQNREWFGDELGTAQALQRAQGLVQRHQLPRLRFELACVEMSAALKASNLPLADRLFREIEALRPAIRPGRLPHGLRAQALYLAMGGAFAPALQRLDVLLALCAEMEVPARDVGPYQVLRADCLLALGRHEEGLALLQGQADGQQGQQRVLFDARIAVHRAAAALMAPSHGGDDLPHAAAEADALCREALQACAALRYSRFLRPLPQLAARLVEHGLRLGVATEFLRDVVHERRLQPTDPCREDWPWRLRVRALGPLQIWRDALPLAAGSSAKAQRKPLELLCLLAAHGGGPLAVSLVVDELWPSLDLDAPRASFEMAVSRLRKLLGVPDAVRVADDAVSLDPTLVWLDVAAFEGLSSKGDPGDDASRSQRARTALALYRAPLLGSQPLQGLLHTARGRLAMAHEALVRSEAERLLTRGATRDALAVLQQALLLDPLNEPLHRLLMQAHLQCGERAEVLRVFRRLQSLLAARTGLRPAEQTLALAREAGLDCD
ncbi:BTAD domain-containing putative transcriptional regulator [Inhella sp.]|uniref:BTAD domain-containing putative transcriptional regulator n=1 Tax=Inhella sp. TaxID=1921806 RepID=UPI0035B18472